MIRRTLINRARRQRDLARMLIARHSLLAYDRSQSHLGYRPTASSDGSFAFAVSAEPAAPSLDQTAPSEDAPVELFAAWPESPAADTSALFDPAPPASLAYVLGAITDLESAQAVLDAAEPMVASAASAQPTTAANQRSGNTLADLVRRMRDPAWTPPEAALPATTTPTSAATEPTANERIADMVHQMQKPPQRTTPAAGRPRIPLGQRMSEAADFGQTPASPREERPAAVSVPAAQPAPYHELSAEVADVQPAAEHSAAEATAKAADSMIAVPAVTIADGEQRSIVVRSEGDSVDITRAPVAVNADTPRIALPLPNSTLALDGAEAAAALSPTAPAVSNARPATAAAPDASAADRPAAWTQPVSPSMQLDDSRNAPQVQLQSSRQKDAGASPALLVSVPSDLRAPADIQPSTASDARRPVAAAKQGGNADRRVTPTVEDLRQPIDLPPALPMHAHTQSAEPASAAPAITLLTEISDRPAPAAISEPSTRPSREIYQPQVVAHDQPRGPTEHEPSAVTFAHTDIYTQADAGLSHPAEPELQYPPAEADAQIAPIHLPSVQAFDNVGDRPAPFEPAQGSRPASIRQPESGLPQVQSPSLPAPSAQPTALTSPPTSSAGLEPAADSQPISGAQDPNIERASAPQEAAESAPTAPDRSAPQAWATRLSPPDHSASAQIADTTRNASKPNTAQQPASDPPSPVGRQLDVRDPAPDHSTRQPAAALDRATPTDEHTGQAAHARADAIDVPALEAEARISQSAPAQHEHISTLSQQLRVPKSDDISTRIAPSGKDAVAAPRSAETPLARSSDVAKPPGAITAANDPSQIATEYTPAPTTAVSFDQEPGSALPSPARRSSTIRDVPATTSGISTISEHGTPQARAAHRATDRQVTEPQPEPTAAGTPAAPDVNQTQGTPSEPQVIQSTSARLAIAIDNLTPSIPARFIPARRDGSGVELFNQAHIRPTTAGRSPIAHDIPTTPVSAETIAPAPGSPQAWAARLATHRQATEPQSEPTVERIPATPVSAETTASAPGSPQAWAARLFPEAQPASPQIPPSAGHQSVAPTDHQNVSAATPTTAQSLPPSPLQRAPDNLPQLALRRAVPTPIAETTRRFLQPLLGIDPAEVRVFRGPVASQVTAAYQAEALASGDIVALAAEHGEDTPATLGVLAHELTHIARQRDSRFVPPLVRRENMSGAANEESLAQSVESQVRWIARDQAEATWRAPMPLDTASSSAGPGSVPIDAPAQARLAAHGASIAGAPRAESDTQPIARGADWGGLPAPWEPLPEWIDAPKQAEMPAPAVPQPARSAPSAQQAASRNGAPSAPLVQLAETGRMLDALPAQSAPAAAPSQQPAPDLDALARQVYAVLKQRLAAERRRSQS
jgi:hypothetical protein